MKLVQKKPLSEEVGVHLTFDATGANLYIDDVMVLFISNVDGLCHKQLLPEPAYSKLAAKGMLLEKNGQHAQIRVQ